MLRTADEKYLELLIKKGCTKEKYDEEYVPKTTTRNYLR